MSGIIDYIKWRGDISFSQSPLNELDAVIFCMISYWPLENIVPKEFSQSTAVSITEICQSNVLDELPPYCPPAHREMRDALKTSKRFEDIKACGYKFIVDKEAGVQFSAVVFIVNWKTIFITFMGTDNSLIGWKENMDLAYNDEVPAQKMAVNYIKEVEKKFLFSNCYIGGHSKGGNLSIYGAAFTKGFDYLKIINVFNFDGPGFNGRVSNSPEIKKIQDKVKKFVPQNSLVGLLLENTDNYQVIQSNVKGALQHDPFTWDACGTNLIYLDELDGAGEDSYEVIKNWIEGMSYEEKEKTVRILYCLVDDYDTLDDILTAKGLLQVYKRYLSLNINAKKTLGSAVGALSRSILDSLLKFDFPFKF